MDTLGLQTGYARTDTWRHVTPTGAPAVLLAHVDVALRRLDVGALPKLGGTLRPGNPQSLGKSGFCRHDGPYEVHVLTGSRLEA